MSIANQREGDAMKKNLFVLSFIIMFSIAQLNIAFAQDSESEIEFASTPNPVGSGARAMGMGGAFIGVADDATAASWNPGGLVQLKKTELSVVANGFHRVEDNAFGHYSETGSQSVSEKDINYLSITCPFNIFDRNMVISLNYQHLYNFTREWHFSNKYTDETPEGKITTDEIIDYQQDGNLSAIGIAYCIQIIPQFSLGFTLNFWDDDLLNNEWEVNFHSSGSQTIIIEQHPPMTFPQKKRKERNCIHSTVLMPI